MISRHSHFISVAAAASAAFALLLLAASTAAAEPTKLRVGVVPVTDAAPFYAAAQEGYFTEQGLDVTTSMQNSGVIGIPAAVAGVYDVVYGSVPTIFLALQEGLDLRIIAMGGPSGPPDFAALLKRKGEDIHSGKDLHGKTIAINDGKGVQSLFARAWVKATGGDPDKVVYRTIPIPAMVDALKIKQADAVFAIDPFLSAGLADPSLEVLGYPFSTVLPHVRVTAYIVTGDYAQKHPDIIAKFNTALAKGARWINANAGTEPYFRLVSSFTKLDPARVAQLKVPPAMTEIDTDALQKLVDLMHEDGMLTSPIDPLAKVFVPRQ